MTGSCIKYFWHHWSFDHESWYIRNATQWEFRSQAWASMPHVDDRNILLKLYNLLKITPASGSWNFYLIVIYHFFVRPMCIEFSAWAVHRLMSLASMRMFLFHFFTGLVCTDCHMQVIVFFSGYSTVKTSHRRNSYSTVYCNFISVMPSWQHCRETVAVPSTP